MELGLSLVAIRPERMPELAARAEEIGYDSLWAPDHVIFPVHFESKNPETPDGEAYPPGIPLYDPWISLQQCAQVTSTIKLGTAIYILALRHPLEVARMVATLDHLSGGRVILGVGAGWLGEEFEALGINPKTRFSRLEESVEAIRALWTDKEAEYHGKHFDFDPVYFEPKPKTPIVFGGYSDNALRRAVRLGDGWLSGGDSGEGEAGLEAIAFLQRRVQELQEEMEIDRPFPITVVERAPGPDFVEGLAKLGVERLVVLPWTRSKEAIEKMEAYYEVARSVL